MSGRPQRAPRAVRTWITLASFVVLASHAANSANSRSVAHAHPLAPSSWILRETRDAPPGTLHVTWRRPSPAPRGERLVPVLPARCTVAREDESMGDAVLVATSVVHCGAGPLAGLAGERLAVRGLGGSDANVYVELQLRDGRRFDALLHARAPSVRFEERTEARRSTTAAFVTLGVGHLLGGADHVLFVLGLVLLVSRLRDLIWLVSAFTLGHSVSLALSATGVVRLAPAPVEVLIAFSLLWLGLRVLDRRARLGEEAPLDRRAALVCTLFGLLHGLGFASAFAEAGASGDALPGALFGFNVGVELGQLVLVVPAAWLLRALRAHAPDKSWEPRLLGVGAYVIGTASAYFVLDRTPSLVIDVLQRLR